MTIGVDHQGFEIAGSPDTGKVVEVNMTVDKVFGLKDPHKRKEGLETPVTAVFLIVDPLGRGVSQKDVEETAPENTVKQKAGKKF
jgi:hypothetical protein